MDGSIMIIDTACRIKEQAIIFQSQQHRKYVVQLSFGGCVPATEM